MGLGEGGGRRDLAPGLKKPPPPGGGEGWGVLRIAGAADAPGSRGHPPAGANRDLSLCCERDGTLGNRLGIPRFLRSLEDELALVVVVEVDVPLHHEGDSDPDRKSVV